MADLTIIKATDLNNNSVPSFVGTYLTDNNHHAGIAIWFQETLTLVDYNKLEIRFRVHDHKQSAKAIKIAPIEHIESDEVEFYKTRIELIHHQYVEVVHVDNYMHFNPPNYFKVHSSGVINLEGTPNARLLCTCVGYSLLLLNSFYPPKHQYLDHDDWASEYARLFPLDLQEYQIKLVSVAPDQKEQVKYAFRILPIELLCSACAKAEYHRKYKPVEKLVRLFKENYPD